jgi:hypothetical protein
MKKTALLAAIFLIAACPLMAKPYHGQLYHGPLHHSYGHVHQAYRYMHHSHRGLANAGHVYRDSRHAQAPDSNVGAHSNITCDMVRSYVAQVGLQQARAMAIAAGMTASEERRARQCLANKV